MSCDLLIIGPHPDDIEIGLAGTVARHVADGRRVGLCDLTAGELGTNGTVEDRRREAEAARDVLGAAWRVNLGWPDGGITPTPEILRSGVDLIRAERPRAIAIPYWEDRHPDHVTASQVLDLVIFRSGLRRYETGTAPWRPEWTCYYFLNMWTRPSFVVDVSAYYDTKRAALRCHETQFSAAAHPDRTATRLNVSTFFQMIESRDAQFGAQIGVAFAEGIVVREPVARSSLLRGEP